MSKFIKGEDIPADVTAVAFWEEDGQTQYQYSRTPRGAKMISSKHKDSPTRGWSVIEKTDREHGLMIW